MERERQAKPAALCALVLTLLPVLAHAQSIPDPAAEGETSLSPATVARQQERVEVEMPEVDLDLVNGNPRARALDARRVRLAWAGTVQGGLVLALLPRAVRTLQDTGDPGIRAVTGSWIALGATIVNVTAILGAHASLWESRLYRCNNQRTSRRAGRAAMALAVIPGLALVSPLFAYRQHQANERTRACELHETLRARRVHLVHHEAHEEESP